MNPLVTNKQKKKERKSNEQEISSYKYESICNKETEKKYNKQETSLRKHESFGASFSSYDHFECRSENVFE
jgi:hypothetical protein